jgi:tRNA (adenine57-N1/adenine58-N1)-methyltransferase
VPAGQVPLAVQTDMDTSGVLAAGELVLLIDNRDRRYLVRLSDGGEFHTHGGVIAHDDMIGSLEGSQFRSLKGIRYVAWRPTLAEFILHMPRGAQVIYPKDLGAILMRADVFPGARVFESGLGSGALSMALLRAGAQITGYEIREDFLSRARKNVEAYLGEEALASYTTSLRDAYEGIDERNLDRVVLDLPEPWRIVDHACAALRPGGLFLAYLPSIMQVVTLRNALDAAGFQQAETVELLQRGWHVEDPAVRPNHRMQGHTGFLTHARLPHGASTPS